MTAVTIAVTPDDIVKGTPKDCLRCAVYRAVRRVTPQLLQAGYRLLIWDVGRDKPWVSTRTPDPARLFMRRLDDGWDVQPFEFELHVPDGIRVVTP